VAHSCVAPHLPRLDGTDAHLWFGWYEGEVDELSELAATVPRLVRFVSEFGAQAVPGSDGFLEPDAWPDLAWERVVEEFGGQTAVFDQRVSPDDFATFADWRDATQAYQAFVVRRTIEILRRLKYRPTGGFCLYKLSDTTPAVGFGVNDHERVPKAAYATLRDCCQPVLAVVDVPRRIAASTEASYDVHVVSDLRHELGDATVTIELRAGEVHTRWGFRGDLPADSCVKVGEIGFTAPPAGRVAFTLRVRHPDLGEVVRAIETSVV
jgi:beta-mannosidase